MEQERDFRLRFRALLDTGARLVDEHEAEIQADPPTLVARVS